MIYDDRGRRPELREKALAAAPDVPFWQLLEGLSDECIVYAEESTDEDDRRIDVCVRLSSDTEFLFTLARRAGWEPESVSFERGRVTFCPRDETGQVDGSV